ncbi:hypothetical protein V5O48_018901, partial [Marasmius crinis-equi]
MPLSTNNINIPVFAGHGTTAMTSPATREQIIRDASHPSGALLVGACYNAFRRELSSLAAEDVNDLISPAVGTSGEFLSLMSEAPTNNPFLSGLSLLLVQSLRYLVYVEANQDVTDSLNPFSEYLHLNSEHGVGVVGFSSGILPACAVASSEDGLSFMRHTVEIFRYAFWLGLRSDQYQHNAIRKA